MIDLVKSYQTRDGRSARIIATDIKGINNHAPIAVAVDCGNFENIYRYHEDGRYDQFRDNPLDLVETSEAR